MSSHERRNDGVPFRIGAVPGGVHQEESSAGANKSRDETLRLRSVERSAGESGMEIRHSDYGYSLIGADRKSVNGRNDMSLKEVEAWLKAARK